MLLFPSKVRTLKVFKTNFENAISWKEEELQYYASNKGYSQLNLWLFQVRIKTLIYRREDITAKKKRNSRNILLEEQDKNNLVTCFMMYILKRQSCETPPLTFLLHLLISPVSLAKLPEIFSKCPYMNRETKDLYSTSM